VEGDAVRNTVSAVLDRITVERAARKILGESEIDLKSAPLTLCLGNVIPKRPAMIDQPCVARSMPTENAHTLNVALMLAFAFVVPVITGCTPLPC